MHPKLLCDSETDTTANRHKLSARRMSDIPIEDGKSVHSRTQAEVRRDARQHYIAAGPGLIGIGNAVSSGVYPGDSGSDKPLAPDVRGFIRTVGEPEARFRIATEPRFL